MFEQRFILSLHVKPLEIGCYGCYYQNLGTTDAAEAEARHAVQMVILPYLQPKHNNDHDSLNGNGVRHYLVSETVLQKPELAPMH